VVTSDPVNARFRESGTPENVSTTDNDSNLDIQAGDFPDLYSDPVNHIRINAIVFVTQQRFAAEL